MHGLVLFFRKFRSTQYFVTVAVASLYINSAARAEVIYEGSVEPVKQAHVAAEMSSRIKSVNVEAGQSVKKGQLLVSLDGQAPQAQAQAAQAQVTATQAQLNLVTRDLLRKQQLFSRNYISQAALDQASAAVKAAQANVNAASAQAKAAQTMANYQSVYAPFSGRVTRVNAQQGDLASPSAPLLHLYQPQAMRVVLNLPLSAVKTDSNQSLKQLLQQATIRLNTTDDVITVFPTSVDLIAAVNPQSLTQQVRFNLSSDVSQKLMPGQNAAVLLPINTSSSQNKASVGAVYVPASSVVHRGDLSIVYVTGHGKPQMRIVREGPTSNGSTEILSGLKKGERVLVHPAP